MGIYECINDEVRRGANSVRTLGIYSKSSIDSSFLLVSVVVGEISPATDKVEQRDFQHMNTFDFDAFDQKCARCTEGFVRRIKTKGDVKLQILTPQSVVKMFVTWSVLDMDIQIVPCSQCKYSYKHLITS